MEHWNNNLGVKLFLSFVLILSVNFAFAGISKAIAMDYFVAASNGNDSNPGTKAAPFHTLKKGVSVLSPGDSLLVRQGTYLGSSSLSNIPNGKSWAEPVTLKAYNEEKVVILANPGQTVLTLKDRQYMIFDGFIFDGKDGHAGIRGDGSHHIRILNGEVMNAPSQGILLAGGTEYFEMINLHIHDNGTTVLDHGIYITTDHHLVKDCTLYRNAGWGVHIYSGTHSWQPDFNLVLNNKIYDNARLGDRGVGIGIYNGTKNAAINNLIWGNKDGIVVNYGASYTKVYNNTLYGNSQYGIFIGDGSNDVDVWNNIVSSSSSTGIFISKSSKDSKIKNNLLYGNNGGGVVNQSDTTTLSNNLVGSNFNPQFQDPLKLNFRLKDLSPAIKAGLVISEVTFDFDYKLRPENTNYDIGAFQMSATLSPIDFTPPAAPKNVQIY